MKTFPHITLFFIVTSTLIACATATPQANLPVPEQGAIGLVTETAVVQPSITPSPTLVPTIDPTQTSTPLPTPTTTATQTPPNTPQPTPTVVALFLEAANLAYAGTTIPEAYEPINAANLEQLTHVAQWGNGTILGVAFAPDGKSFVVGSAVGFAVYDTQNLDESPRWVPWARPYFYESISFSADGSYLLLENNNSSQVYRVSDGQQVSNRVEVTWVNASRLFSSDRTLLSADETLQFKSHSVASEDNMNIEIVVQEMYNNDTGTLRYQFDTETMYVQFRDYHEPEGCDLNAFSMCGNAYDPSAMQPYRGAFSPTGETLAVLYRAWNLRDDNRFSVLRVYRVADGQMVAQFGDFTHPVETFAYAPDGRALLVGYVEGSIELRDILQNTRLFTAQQFDAPIIDLTYSFDGKYLVVQRVNWIEVRRTDTGTLQNRYRAGTFALSPTANLIALGQADGRLILRDMMTDQPIHTIQAHEAEIYALAFSPEGTVLTSSGADCRVQSWDVSTGMYLYDFAENVTDAYEMGDTESRIFIKDMTYIPGTDQLIGYGSWSRVVNWQTTTGNTQYMIEPEPLTYYNGMMTLNPHFPEFLGFDLDSQSLLIDAVEYDLETGEQLGEYQMPDALPADCMPVGPTTTDGKVTFTRGYGSHRGQVCILDATDSHLIQAVQMISDTADIYDPIEWVYLSPDGVQLLISTYSGVLHVYQIER